MLLASLGTLWSGGSAACAAPARAAASSRTPPSKPVTLERVKVLFRKGRALFVKREFAASLGPLKRSFDMLGALHRRATTTAERKKYRKYQKAFLATLAIAYHWNKQYVESYQFYKRCVTAKPSKKLVQLCQTNLPKVLRFLARLEIETQPKKVTLVVKTKDGTTRQAPVPYRKWLTPGSVAVEVSATGYTTLQRTLVLQPGIRAKFVLQLEKPSCPPSARPAPVAGGGRGERMVLGSLGATPGLTAGAPPAPASVPQPFSTPWPAWQIGLVVAGAAVGAAVIGLGSYGIYTAVTRRDKFVIR